MSFEARGPPMFDALLRGVERYAVGINNKASLPSRGRLLSLLKKYVPHGATGQLDRQAFHNFVRNEHRSIPASAYDGLYDYISLGNHVVTLHQLVGRLLPDRFSKGKGLLDMPCTYHDKTKQHESAADGAEIIRQQMIQFLAVRKLKLRDYFNNIDTDNSHSIDTRELIASLRHDNLGIGRYKACRHLIHRFDSSLRGRLTFPDFQNLMQPATPKVQARLSKIAAAMLRKLGAPAAQTTSTKPRSKPKPNVAAERKASWVTTVDRPFLVNIDRKPQWSINPKVKH